MLWFIKKIEMIRPGLIILLFSALYSCNQSSVKPALKSKETVPKNQTLKETSLVILGTIQDAGSPQIGCVKECCIGLSVASKINRKVSALGIIDPDNNTKYLIDATPDIVSQTEQLNSLSTSKELLNGIFLTHAHIGHYTGLMHLGKEAMNSNNIPVFTMSRMKTYLEKNGPWSQLVNNKNIQLKLINDRDTIHLNNKLKLIPFLVPHRDEYSETVGYKIIGPNRKALFIPDIDKWKNWNQSIINEISKVDFAFIDGTFYDAEEVNHRDLSEIPHPFIIESMEALKNLSKKEKNKVYFIHLNHTNPAINEESKAYKTILINGFHVAQINEVISL